jgi:hypothetical protein
MYTGSSFPGLHTQAQITLEALHQHVCLLRHWLSRCEGRSDLYLEHLFRVLKYFLLPFPDVEYAMPPEAGIAYTQRVSSKGQMHSFLPE